MSYELRKLTSKDIFPIVKLISKFGVNEFKKCFDPENVKGILNEKGEISGEITEYVGMSIVFDVAAIVMSNISKCENEIYDFLSSVSNLDRKQIEELSPAEFAQMIIDIIQKEEFADFYGVVSKLLK